MSNIVFILMAHMTGDYLFQSDYLAMNKGKDNYILLAHSVLYAVGVALIAYIFGMEISSIKLFLIGALHFPMDYIKARGITTKIFGDKKALMIDQFTHYWTLYWLV